MASQNRARRMIDGVRRALVTDPAKRRMTEAIPIIDDALASRIIHLAMRIASTMLSIGASSREVAEATLRVTRAYGLRRANVDVTFTSLTVSDHRDGSGQPITLMQVVQSVGPDHQKLQRLHALVNEIDRGMELADAAREFHRIRRTPFMYRPGIVVVVSSLLAVAVAIMYRAGWVVLLASGLAALCVVLTQRGLTRIRIPVFFSQVLGGVVLTAVAALVASLGRAGIEPFVGVRVSLIVASGIILMLAGVAIVGAAQDAIDGFSLTATGRILDLTVMTLGLVVGILVGLQIADALGVGVPVPTDEIAFDAWPYQLIGSCGIAAAVAVMNGGGLRIVLVSTGLGGIAWLGSYAVNSGLDLPSATAPFAGALLASVIGAIFAMKLHVPTVAVTTAAIIPLVPGAVLFRGLLGIVQSGTDQSHLFVAFDSLLTAGMIGIALAAGATLGIVIGMPIQSRLSGQKFRFRATSRPVSGAGTARLEVVEVPTREVPAAPLPDPVAHTPERGEEEPPITRPFDVNDLNHPR